MNIWIFNHYAVGPGSSGITRHLDLANALVKMGHTVTIFASSFNHQRREEEQEYKNRETVKEVNYDGVNFCWIKTPKYKKNDFKRVKNILIYSFRLYKLYKKRGDRPDVVIGSLMHPLAAILGYKAAKYYSAEFYFEERDLWPQSLIDLGKVSVRNPLVKVLSALELFLYKKANKIIVLFDKAPMYVKSRGIDEEKIIYLPNGVDLSRYNETKKIPLNDQIHNFFELQKDKFIVIYTGAHSLANYLESIMDIAKEMKLRDTNIEFLLIGDGPNKKELMKQAKEEKIDNITFLPAVQKEEIPSILKKADIGIFALRDAEVYKWGISLNKMYDYMAAGLPIAVYTKLKDTIIERESLGIVSGDVNEMVDQIIYLRNKREVLKDYKEKNNMYVYNNHTWKKLAERLDSNFK